MKVAFRFTVTLDPKRFADWQQCDLAEVRRILVWELAADITESPAITNTGAHIDFVWVGGEEIPQVHNPGWTLRQQLRHDELNKWG